MTPERPLTLTEIDPFDLPEWLGEERVVWAPQDGLSTGHLVPGRLTASPGEAAAPAPDSLPCDLLAVDEAYPTAVTEPDLRVRAHQVWKHGQVLLTTSQERLTLAVPGTSFTADRTLECLYRLALAVGARSDHFSALLSLGSRSSTHRG